MMGKITMVVYVCTTHCRFLIKGEDAWKPVGEGSIARGLMDGKKISARYAVCDECQLEHRLANAHNRKVREAFFNTN